MKLDNKIFFFKLTKKRSKVHLELNHQPQKLFNYNQKFNQAMRTVFKIQPSTQRGLNLKEK
jgi:glucose-6-phosphate 1-dehydrogenase